ncbi:MAG: hypothetical protein HY789_06255, partial [Deltaproteobacteria bacterium]|nr:hypothetical protein [Deltaproteobacteria bacterium]
MPQCALAPVLVDKSINFNREGCWMKIVKACGLLCLAVSFLFAAAGNSAAEIKIGVLAKRG